MSAQPQDLDPSLEPIDLTPMRLALWRIQADRQLRFAIPDIATTFAAEANRRGGRFDPLEAERLMNHESINFGKKFGLFDEQWQPKVIAEMNDYQFKIAKLQGDFIWHDHKTTDEAFIVLEGTLRIDFRDGAVHVRSGEMFVVPKGLEHKPYAEKEVKLLLIEPRGVLNTGREGGDRTAENDVWI